MSLNYMRYFEVISPAGGYVYSVAREDELQSRFTHCRDVVLGEITKADYDHWMQTADSGNPDCKPKSKDRYKLRFVTTLSMEKIT